MWARIGSLQILSKHSENATRWVVVKPGWGGVWAVGVVRVWGGCGQALATFTL